MAEDKMSKALTELFNDAENILADTFIADMDVNATTSFIFKSLIPAVLKIPRDDISDGTLGFFQHMKQKYDEYYALDEERVEAVMKLGAGVESFAAEIEAHRKQLPVLQDLNDWMTTHITKEIPQLLAFILLDSVTAEIGGIRSCIARCALGIIHPEPPPPSGADEPRKKKGKRRPKKDDDKDKPTSEPGSED